MKNSFLIGLFFVFCYITVAQAQVITENLYINEAQHEAFQKQLNEDMKVPFTRFAGNRDTLTLPFFDDFSLTDITWKPCISGTIANLHGVHMINNKVGFAVGDNATLLKTTNRGRSWQPITINTEANIYALQFINEFAGFAVGSKGLFLKTTDGGINWQLSNIDGADDLYTVHFISATRGFAAGGAGLLFTTIDGGATWTPIAKPGTAIIRTIKSYNATTVYMAGDSGYVWRYNLSNGQIDGPAPNLSRKVTFYDMDATADGRIIAVGSKGAIFINFMGDNNWYPADPQRSDTNATIRAVKFFGNNDAWAVGDSGLVLTSATRGWSWEQIRYPKRFNFTGISLTSPDKGTLVGNTGLILISNKDRTRPFSRHWKSNSGVYINNTFCVNPPTVNAATFDGLDISGMPYARTIPGVLFIPDQYGGCDTLTSLPIDLEGLNENDNVALSYYWQAGGRALQLFPDSIDFLFLQFKTASEEWYTVDSVKGGQYTIQPFKYRQVFLKQPYLHKGFQFRFLSTGNRTGNFDLWHIDMVYLDNFRSPNDTCANDVSFYPIENNLLKTYTAIPFEHLQEMLEQGKPIFNDTVRTYARNFNEAGLVNITGDFTIVDKDEPSISYLNVSSQDDDFEGFGNPLLRCGIPFDDPIRQQTTYHRPIFVKNMGTRSGVLAALGQPADLQYRFTIRDRDQFNTFYQNDTTLKTITFRDHYAYDDGSAELSRGVGGNNSRAAIKFFVEKTDTLTDIALNFQRTPFSMDRTISFNLMAWDNITENTNQGQVRFRRLVVLPPTDSVNKIFTFSLRNLPIATRIFEGGKYYYFGWQQGLTENSTEVRIGVDVNNETDTVFFYNTSGVWLRYKGDAFALIFRPVFGREVPTSTKPSAVAQTALIYPNPNKGLIKVQPNVSSLEIMDLRGKVVLSKSIKHEHERQFEFKPAVTGIYLAKVYTHQGEIYIQKIIFE